MNAHRLAADIFARAPETPKIYPLFLDVRAINLVSVIKLPSFAAFSGENNDIGHNYRNKLAHLFNVYKSSLSLSTVCLLMYLLTDVLNTIYAGLLDYE